MRTLCRITGMLALAFLAAQAVRAQGAVLANIPFALTAVAMTLPGEYRTGKLALRSAVLLMQGTDNSEATFVMPNGTEANRPQTKSKLIFHCHGNRYVLSQIWVEGNSRGIRLLTNPSGTGSGLAKTSLKRSRLLPPRGTQALGSLPEPSVAPAYAPVVPG
jgi:hypothetical protein